MIVHREIAIKSNDIYIYTEGLAPIIGKEIRLNIGKQNEKDYIEVIKYIIDYVVNENQIISDNQTIAYYSWALKFKIQDNSYFELFEISENGDNFNKGCDLTISIIRSQSEICSQCELIPVFPNFSQQIVISKGVYEGKDIEGIRYESPEHMSGWWLITDDYDDNIESLMTVHYYHVAFKRPDILKYLALPYGYRFLMGNGNIQIAKDE